MALLFGFFYYTQLVADVERMTLRDYQNPLVYQQNVY